MGAPALLWPPLLLPLLVVLVGQPPGTSAQSQGMCWTGAGWVGEELGWKAPTSPLQLSSLLRGLELYLY